MTILSIYIYYSFIPTDDWVRPMKHFVLEKLYISTPKMYI